VDAIKRRARRVRFVEIGQVVVDKMLEGLCHVTRGVCWHARGAGISRWYNKRPP
jgi:ribose 5-phosphate isomerase RpiB